MAFRRGFKRRFPRRLVRRRPLARVRRTWITSLLPGVCEPLLVDLPACPDELNPHSGRATIVLVDKSTLEEKFSDRAAVVRVFGDLWFAPTWDGTVDPTCSGNFVAAFSAYGMAHIGLRKRQENKAGEVLNVDALNSGEPDSDYSEAEWLKTWQHVWIPDASLEYQPQYQKMSCVGAICPDVHTSGALSNDFVDGTGTIEISTDCGEMQTSTCEVTQLENCIQHVKYPRTWHVHFDVKKRIGLREMDGLVLDMAFVWPNAALLTNPHMTILGGLKTLLQY